MQTSTCSKTPRQYQIQDFSYLFIFCSAGPLQAFRNKLFRLRQDPAPLRILKDAKIKIAVKKGTGDGRNQTDKSFHSWRHTVNSMLANNGVDVRLRQLISDHESQEMNAIYTHPDLEAIKKALEPIVKKALRGGSAGR